MNRSIATGPDIVGIVRHDTELSQLAVEINRSHRAAVSAVRTGVQHAITTGELLTKAKAACRHGQWLDWLKANCPDLSTRQVQKYMKLNNNRERLAVDTATGATINGLLDSLTGDSPNAPPGAHLDAATSALGECPPSLRFLETSQHAWSAIGHDDAGDGLIALFPAPTDETGRSYWHMSWLPMGGPDGTHTKRPVTLNFLAFALAKYLGDGEGGGVGSVDWEAVEWHPVTQADELFRTVTPNDRNPFLADLTTEEMWFVASSKRNEDGADTHFDKFGVPLVDGYPATANVKN